jgi:thiol:disulfide interchange protein DsbC
MHTTLRQALRNVAAAALIGVLCAGPVAAQTAGKKMAEAAASTEAGAGAEAANIKRLLEQKFPGAQVSNVAKTGYMGLYEAQFDGQMVYTDAKVAYVLVGSVYDTATKQNLSEERLRKLNRVAWDSLPLDLAIKKVKGNGQRKLVVFSDADCPFCARLESELKSVDDVTIYTFLYPIDQLHPDSARKSKIIWCAPDRIKAWDEFFASGKLPDNKGDCETPLAVTHELGQKLRVSATPTLVFADGSIVPGALPRQRLETEMSNAEAELKKTAAAPKK